MEYNWAVSEPKPDPPRAKLLVKFRMTQQVVDVLGQMWIYHFKDGKIHWLYMGLIKFES